MMEHILREDAQGAESEEDMGDRDGYERRCRSLQWDRNRKSHRIPPIKLVYSIFPDPGCHQQCFHTDGNEECNGSIIGRARIWDKEGSEVEVVVTVVPLQLVIVSNRKR